MSWAPSSASLICAANAISRPRVRTRWKARLGADALTGLLDRHAIERRCNDLFHLGFRTMAVIDPDHFKRINDRNGHSVGDRVLKAVAEALEEDGVSCAIRMGGEEFLLLLLRGTKCRRRRRTLP
jgi:diguanylate cyclase (GGDEF)-like protein